MAKKEKTIDFEQWDQKIKIIETGTMKTVLVMNKPYMVWDKTDEAAPKFAMVQLYQQGIATQEELAETFQVHAKSVYNYISEYKECGMKGLIEQDKGPKESWKVTPDVRCKILYIVLIERMKEYAKIQEILKRRWKQKLSVESIRQVLRENGFLEEKITTCIGSVPELFDEEQDKQMRIDFGYSVTGEVIKSTVPTEEAESGVYEKDKIGDEDKEGKYSNRKMKWLSRYSRSERKYLDDIERGGYNGYAGGLLFNVLLKKYNYIPMMRRIIDNKIEYDYDLEDMCLTLFHYDLFGFNSIRKYGYAYYEEFGILIGKSNSPSRFTLQRFLKEVKAEKKGEALMEEFAREYLRVGLIKWGEIYIDGHFQP